MADYPPKNIPIEKIDISVFAIEIARVIMDLKSSHCYFIAQMAFGENKSWDDVEKICNKILNNPHSGT